MATSEGSGQGQRQQVPAKGGQEPKFGGLQKLWCPFYLKGKCTGGGDCPLPHVSDEAKNSLQAAIATNKKKGAK